MAVPVSEAWNVASYILKKRIKGRKGESYYTGTGFPRVFYLGYHLYKQYFPLPALTTYRKAMERGEAV